MKFAITSGVGAHHLAISISHLSESVRPCNKRMIMIIIMVISC
nr:MAG TPA_asm: hypothetical protein [Caudoviricetes sp.]